ncbi:gamma-glutamyltransferase, partial [Salmonella enterica subsp. enterica serovar Anatum]|nr:gamma-glutamyltransferase [Salmonella enterica subsp. enterica serovar Anatum]
DEVAASEGFLKQPAGKEYAFAGPSVKDKKYFGDGTGVGLRKDGNAVAVTYTLNTTFGTGIVAGNTGILLNNQMDDFSAKPGV